MTNCIAKIIDYKGTLTYTTDCCENYGAVNQNNLIVKRVNVKQ